MRVFVSLVLVCLVFAGCGGSKIPKNDDLENAVNDLLSLVGINLNDFGSQGVTVGQEPVFEAHTSEAPSKKILKEKRKWL